MSQGPCIYQHCHCHVAESGHQRATGGPPEHDSGASKGGGRDAQCSYSREETTISLFNHYMLEYLILLQPGGKTRGPED